MNEMVLNWKGEAVTEKVRHAIRWGIDSTTSACVIDAKSLVPVRTSILQGSIQMRPAEDFGDRITGYWGSFATAYAIYVEKGTRPHMPPVDAIEKGMRVSRPEAWRIALAIKRYGTRPHPYLTPAAETHYPSLGLRIRAQLEWGK
jgi:hypothetical protein